MAVLKDVLVVVAFAITNYFIYRAIPKSNRNADVESEIQLNKRRKVMRTLNTAVVVFILLVLPKDMLYTITYFRNLYESVGTEYKILEILQYSNSVVNVFIYARLHKTFREIIFRKDRPTRYVTNLTIDTQL